MDAYYLGLVVAAALGLVALPLAWSRVLRRRDDAALAAERNRFKVATDELARESNLLRSILDHAPEAIVVKDLDSRFLVINQEGARRLGASHVADVIGRTAGDFLSASTAEAVECEDREVIRSGQPILNLQRQSLNDRISGLWISVSKIPLRDSEGRVIGLIAINRDITELRNAIDEAQRLNVELEERVRLRTAELEEANRELEAFPYSVSHDLRAPLRRVNGFLQILRNAAHARLSDEERGTRQRIAVAVQRMDQLIEDMLYLSRVAGQEIRVSDVDLSALAEQVAADLRSAEPARELTMLVSPGIRTRADPRLMRIVLDNLIGNAWKFTGRAAAPRIEFGLATDGGEPAYYVRDNGAGFDMEHAGRLFGAFQRLHHADEFPGTGVGLATVARIVRRHGGRVCADARPGAGATFYFTLTS